MAAGLLNGRAVRYRVPAPAVQDGIAYITEDRKVEGFFETMSIKLNSMSGSGQDRYRQVLA